jgi:hypothetical protein
MMRVPPTGCWRLRSSSEEYGGKEQAYEASTDSKDLERRIRELGKVSDR